MRKKNIFTNIILLFLAAGIIFPVVTMFLWTFTERWAWPDMMPQVFSFRALGEAFERRGQMIQVFGSSIFISTVVAVLSAVIGMMTSRAIAFYQFKLKKAVLFFTVLPFMIPSTVFAMGIQTTFIKLGLNNQISGVIVAHLICSLPYAVRLMSDGTEALGNRLEEQARVLGASPWKAFYKTTLPVMTPVILSAVCMSYIVSFSQYFLTLLIGGGNVRTFTIIMVPYLQGGDRNIASIYSAIFLLVTLAVFGIFEWLAGKRGQNVRGDFYA